MFELAAVMGRASGLTQALNPRADIHRPVPRARETRLDGPRWVKQPGRFPGRAAGGDRALCTAQPDQPIGHGLQQQEECPGSLVVGGVSAAFRAADDDIPRCRAHVRKSPSSAALVQKRFKYWEFVGHHGELTAFSPKKVSENFRRHLCGNSQV